MPDTFETPNARMAGDERKLQLLEVAMNLFSKNGFTGTTTKKIAAEASVSEAMVFKHFANKDELYSAILDHKACKHNDNNNPFEHLEEPISKRDDYGVFYGMALHALNEHQDDKGFMRLLLYSALEGHELSKMFFESFVKEAYEFMGGYVRKRQEEGEFREFEPKVAIRALVGMIIHHSMNTTLWDVENSVLTLTNEEAAHNFATILLDGIRAPEAKG